ncbi:plasmid recombination protein, partial [Macrococcoides caseolyticum]|uniref:plasmid recombination protein n=1 Tax=Macrococcoides caseolyticum TaxID=69966 RepID=UPI0039C9929A
MHPIITSHHKFFHHKSHSQIKHFFKNSFHFLQKQYPTQNLLYPTLHLHQKLPHIHFPFVPFTKHRTLSAKQ